jgi:hypothetical protein
MTDAACVHFGRDGAQARRTTAPDVLHCPQVLGELVGVARKDRPGQPSELWPNLGDAS